MSKLTSLHRTVMWSKMSVSTFDQSAKNFSKLPTSTTRFAFSLQAHPNTLTLLSTISTRPVSWFNTAFSEIVVWKLRGANTSKTCASLKTSTSKTFFWSTMLHIPSVNSSQMAFLSHHSRKTQKTKSLTSWFLTWMSVRNMTMSGITTSKFCTCRHFSIHPLTTGLNTITIWKTVSALWKKSAQKYTNRLSQTMLPRPTETNRSHHHQENCLRKA